MYIKRLKEEKFEKLLKTNEIVAIIGPRQAGKTTLINHCLEKIKNKKINKISFDNLELFNEFEHDLELFIAKNITPFDIIFIDEIQYSKNSGQKLKYIYDIYKKKLILSGSSATELSLNTAKYLVGRIFIVELQTLSFQEFVEYKDKDLVNLSSKKTEQRNNLYEKYFKEYLLYGGYPQVVKIKDPEIKIEALKNIFNTYLLKEIKEILEFKNHFKLEKISKFLSTQIANLVNYSEIASSTQIEFKEVQEVISILEKTFILKLVQPFFTNKHTELVKSPKIFFYDLGLRNTLLNITSLNQISNLGELHENFVFCELNRNEFDLKYWRSKSKAEVDFVLEVGENIFPIEVKSNLNNKAITKSFHSFLDKYSPKKSFVINSNLDGSREINQKNIIFLRHYQFINTLKQELSK